jgi:hypothetical protein
MRTKQTGTTRKKSLPNGTPPKDTPVPDVKSPNPPHELTDMDRANLKEFLEKSDKPFQVNTIPFNRKRKRGSPPPVQRDIFDPRLDVQYEIKPANNWDSLRRYKKFTGMSWALINIVSI